MNLASSLYTRPYVPDSVLRYSRRLGWETPHPDDQFFLDAIGGTAVTPTGTAVWTQQDGVLSCVADTQTSGDMAVRLYALSTGSSPVTIETRFQALLRPGNFSQAGLVFSTGVVDSSNAIAYVSYQANVHDIRSGTLTNMSVSEASYTGTLASANGHEYRRLIWSAASTFKIMASPDGVTWSQMETTTFTEAITPTHFGVVCSAYGSGLATQAGFDYLRVYDADLSL